MTLEYKTHAGQNNASVSVRPVVSCWGGVISWWHVHCCHRSLLLMFFFWPDVPWLKWASLVQCGWVSTTLASWSCMFHKTHRARFPLVSLSWAPLADCLMSDRSGQHTPYLYMPHTRLYAYVCLCVGVCVWVGLGVGEGGCELIWEEWLTGCWNWSEKCWRTKSSTRVNRLEKD